MGPQPPSEPAAGAPPGDADPLGVLAELGRSGLALEHLGGNSGKLRLSLDLAGLLPRDGRLRVLDVGCAGPVPMNLWAPFVPLAGRLDLVGVDVAGLERARATAAELGIGIEMHEAGASELTGRFGPSAFDAVVSTQVLEHIPDWRGAVAQMTAVLRPGGRLLLTCDSGDHDPGRAKRVRLAGKRAFARVRARRPEVGRLTDRVVSGEWERGISLAELRGAADAVGLEVERLAPYALSDLKTAQHGAGHRTRMLWLALEETLAHESEAVQRELYTVAYLRARRPA